MTITYVPRAFGGTIIFITVPSGAFTLYGSTTSDGGLASACDLANVAGGVETSVAITVPATALTVVEITSHAGTSNAVASIPATPTGNGWLFTPGSGTFSNAAWSAIISLALASSSASATTTIRFFKRSGGTYTLLGSMNVGTPATAKTVYRFPDGSIPSTSFASGDQVYVDLWYSNSSSNVGGANPTLYVSNAVTAGVVNDLQIITSSFTVASLFGEQTTGIVLDGKTTGIILDGKTTGTTLDGSITGRVLGG